MQLRQNADTSKVLFNSAVTWTRIAGVAIAKLLTIRFLLEALGTDGVGVFFAISSMALLTAFLTGAMQTMSLRVLALNSPIGADVKSVFSNLFGMHLMTATMMLSLGGVSGYLLVNNVMVIPSRLLVDANFAFFCILSATVAGHIFSPYEAFLQSKERFEIFGIIDTLQAWALVIVSFWLIDQDANLIKIYAVAVALFTILGLFAAAFITARDYPEARMELSNLFNREFMRHQFWIASWSLVGGASAAARTHGLVLLVNIFGGPTANAVYAIANQIPNILRQLASTFQMVLAPRIYRQEAVGDRGSMVRQTFGVCRLASMLTLLIAIPFAAEMSHILSIWLGDFQRLTVTVCQLLLISLVLEQLAAGTGTAHLALGRVARFNLIAGGLSITLVPTAYVIAQITGELLHIIHTLIFFTGLVAATKVLLLYPEINKAVSKWLSETIIPLLCFAAPPLLVSLSIVYFFEPSPARLVLSGIASLLTSLPSAFFLGLKQPERERLIALFSSWRSTA